MTNFLPDKYEVPESPSNYMKFGQGKNKFRVLSSAIIGYEYFNKDNKPVRQKQAFTELPEDIKPGGKIKHFWAFVVWNYQAKMVQILELTQKSIMDFIKTNVDDLDWGDPKGYDIEVTRTGEGLDTAYVTTLKPHSPIAEDIATAYLSKPVKLEALYEGKDPFAT